MELTSIKNIKEILESKGIWPSKKLGQNFLVDKNILFKIISSINMKGENILEVGPGLGTLTKELAKEAKRITAVEKDPLMCRILEETLEDFNNVEVINGDILRFNIAQKNYKVVANLPYYITSPLIRKLLEDKSPPKEIFLMVQKEVAERICSLPPEMSLLAAAVQFYAKPKILFKVSKNSFWPKPKVDSAFLEIKPFVEKKIDSYLFFKVVKAGFSHPRKQIVNNLSKELELKKEKIFKILEKSSINPKARAETLSIEDWIKLIKRVASLF